MNKIEWTKDKVLLLVDDWVKFEYLYNPQHRLYHNRNARNEALLKIVDNLLPSTPNVTMNDVKLKINCLRSQYCREVNKQHGLIRNAESLEGICTPIPYWFEKLYFLNPFVKVRNSKSDIGEFDNMDSLDSTQTDEATADNSQLIEETRPDNLLLVPLSSKRDETLQKEREKKIREKKIRENTSAYAAFREKVRGRWENRRNMGKIKLVGDMTEEEKERREGRSEKNKKIVAQEEQMSDVDNSSQYIIDTIEEPFSCDEQSLPSKRSHSSDTNPLIDHNEEIEQIYIKSDPDIMQYMSGEPEAVESSTPHHHSRQATTPATKQTAEAVESSTPHRHSSQTTTPATKQTLVVTPAQHQKQSMSAIATSTSSITTAILQHSSSGNNYNDNSPTTEYDAAFLNFIKVNLGVVTDVTLKDELTDKITMVLLEYKRMQREKEKRKRKKKKKNKGKLRSLK